MIGRALVIVPFVAVALVSSCAVIDEPAPFTKADGGTVDDPRAKRPFERCRVLDRQIATNVKARVYGDAPGPQTVCVTLEISIPFAATTKGAVIFCVAGDLEKVTVPRVRELTGDLEQCAYCTEIAANCVVAADGGTSLSCANAYAVANATARVRIVRLDRAVGGTVWIDLGDLEVARVTQRVGTSFNLERRDCLYADGLTLQGVLERGSTAECSGVDEIACAIARTAGSRLP
jgi:hypothetical protein